MYLVASILLYNKSNKILKIKTNITNSVSIKIKNCIYHATFLILLLKFFYAFQAKLEDKKLNKIKLKLSCRLFKYK